MGNFGNRANFRLPIFEGFTRFGLLRIEKTQSMRNFGDRTNFRLPVLADLHVLGSGESKLVGIDWPLFSSLSYTYTHYISLIGKLMC